MGVRSNKPIRMSLSSLALLLLATCHLSFSFLVNKHQVDKYHIGLDRNTSDHRLHVTLYYESLCPDSRAWVVYQLYPAWEVLKDIFHFTLVPYGKAFTFPWEGEGEQKYQFVCQHDEPECEGNFIHACAIQNIPDKEKQLLFIRCMIFANHDPLHALRRCANKEKLPDETLQEIETCASGSQGNILHKTMGDLTHQLNPRLTWVPHITINGEAHNQQDLRRYFPRVICNLYPGEKPDWCKIVTSANKKLALMSTYRT